MWVYLNNRFVLKKEASVSVFDRGFLYGDGVFETVRAYNGKIFLLSRHLNRLSDAANRLGISIPNADRLTTLFYETLNRNCLRNTLLRLTLTRGETKGKPTLVIFTRPNRYTRPLYKKGVFGQVVTLLHHPQKAKERALKSISFLNHVLAKQEAAQSGAFEAILLNANGYLSEGSISNLFWIRAGRLYTPAVSVGILSGITRALVIELAKENNIETREGFYRTRSLFSADEAFLTSTGLEIMPLIRVNQKKIGTGQPGRMTRQLHQFFKKRLKED